MKREKTQYPGVTFYVREDGEKIYYIRYRTGGRGTKETEEPIGSSAKGMTPARAAQVRSERMTGKAPSNKEVRTERLHKSEEWTLKKIFTQYQSTLEQNRGRTTDKNFFKRLKSIHDKRLSDITSLDVEAVQRELEREGKAPKTIKHILDLLTRSMSYALRSGIIQQGEGIKFAIKKPRIDSKKVENMDDEAFRKYLAALDMEEDKERVAIIKIALFTGMRKNAILALRWRNIDFQRGVIELEGKTAKNRRTSFIPMNANTMGILKELPLGSPEDYLFPSPITGGKREDFRRMARRIKKNAGLPDDFRPMHGLRHTYASRLASSGKVDLYTLQKLLTHESPESTQIYAHLSDEAMRRAAAVADDVMTIEKE